MAAGLMATSAGAQTMEDEPEYIKVDYTRLEKLVTESPETYKRQCERFLKCDETMTVADIVEVYYGYTCTKDYAPYDMDATSRISSLMHYEKFAEAQRVIDSALVVNPSSLSLNIAGLVCANSLGLDVERYQWRFKAATRAIFMTGSGFSRKRALLLNNPADEKLIIEWVIGAEATEQMFDGRCDVVTIRVESDPDGISRNLFFDISRAYGTLKDEGQQM